MLEKATGESRWGYLVVIEKQIQVISFNAIYTQTRFNNAGGPTATVAIEIPIEIAIT